MPIRSGIGIGEAQVYNQPSELVNTYGKVMQKLAADDAKFQSEIADELTKVKTNGIRDIDKPIIAQAYQELKDKYRQASSTRNPSERALYRSEIQNGVNKINEAAARSLEESKTYADILSKAYQMGDWAIDKKKFDNFKTRINTPITQLSAYDPSVLQRLPDDSIINKEFDNLRNETANKASYKVQNVGGGREREVGIVDDDTIKKNIYDRLPKNKEWLNTAMYQFKEANPNAEPTIENVVNMQVELYKNRGRNIYSEKPTRIPKATGTGESSSYANPVDISIPFANGKGIVDAKGYIGLSLPNKNFAGSSAIDLSTGKSVPALESSSDYQIVGIGNFPILKNSEGKIPAGSVSQASYASRKPENIKYEPFVHVQKNVKIGDRTTKQDLLVPFDRLPENVKTSNSIKGILSRFNPVVSNQSSPQAAPKSKENQPSVPSASMSDWKNAGWNDDQIKQAVKAGKIKIK